MIRVRKPERVCDALGRVKAQIADLRKDESDLKRRLIDSELDCVEGDLFRATVSRYTQKEIDYPSLVQFLKVDPRVLARFVVENPRVRVAVKSRRTD